MTLKEFDTSAQNKSQRQYVYLLRRSGLLLFVIEMLETTDFFQERVNESQELRRNVRTKTNGNFG